ncbi:hypothetical protein PILCRDRAFT_533337 [Piloderma croceum F 1598]|uniref:HMG box domain-containing protein n=1 Tax=Piloderma croceum (strain F 1598) TaxID=765440 RepID=A0A0C3FLQ6_PILCF|nr:hypothetical protein PILCRDRAFT_533337 [Piloderma croceum F 1598]
MFANWYSTVEEDTMRVAAILDNTELTDADFQALIQYPEYWKSLEVVFSAFQASPLWTHTTELASPLHDLRDWIQQVDNEQYCAEFLESYSSPTTLSSESTALETRNAAQGQSSDALSLVYLSSDLDTTTENTGARKRKNSNTVLDLSPPAKRSCRASGPLSSTDNSWDQGSSPSFTHWSERHNLAATPSPLTILGDLPSFSGKSTSALTGSPSTKQEQGYPPSILFHDESSSSIICPEPDTRIQNSGARKRKRSDAAVGSSPPAKSARRSGHASQYKMESSRFLITGPSSNMDSVAEQGSTSSFMQFSDWLERRSLAPTPSPSMVSSDLPSFMEQYTSSSIAFTSNTSTEQEHTIRPFNPSTLFQSPGASSSSIVRPESGDNSAAHKGKRPDAVFDSLPPAQWARCSGDVSEASGSPISGPATTMDGVGQQGSHSSRIQANDRSQRHGHASMPSSSIISGDLPSDNENFTNSSRALTGRKPKKEDHIPRPANSFMLFRVAYCRQYSNTDLSNQAALSKMAGIAWRSLTQAEKQHWEMQAAAQKERHQREHPDYCYSNQRTKKPSASKKRSRKDS